MRRAAHLASKASRSPNCGVRTATLWRRLCIQARGGWIVAETVRTLGPEKDAEFDNAPKRNRQAREHHDRAGREISGPEDGVGVANEVDAEAAKEQVEGEQPPDEKPPPALVAVMQPLAAQGQNRPQACEPDQLRRKDGDQDAVRDLLGLRADDEADDQDGGEGDEMHRDEYRHDRQPISAAADPAFEAEKDRLNVHRRSRRLWCSRAKWIPGQGA